MSEAITSTIAVITRCWPMRSGMLPTPVQFAGSRIQAMPSSSRFMRHPPVRPARPTSRRAAALGRDHGMSRRPISTLAQSRPIASTIVATMPVTISAWMPRWSPSVKRLPRLCTPITAPIVARLTVLTITTRSPESSTGPARGSSTPQKRPTSE